MNNDEMKLPDEFFRQGLEHFEVPYNDAAWEDMRSLLDKAEKKRPFLLWFRKNKKTSLTLITITMITTTIISALTIFSTGQKDKTATIYNPGQTAGLQKTHEVFPNGKTQQNETGSTADYAVSGSKNSAPAKAEKSVEESARRGDNQATEIQGTEDAFETDAIVSDKLSADAKVETETEKKAEQPQIAATKTVADAKLDKSNTPAGNTATNGVNPPLRGSYTTFRGPWLGIHFTSQQAGAGMKLDSFTNSYGFNFQMMSPNLSGRNDFGGYLGLDFGALWYGHGQHYGIVLNNTSLDSGFTRLSSHSFDIFARGHFEYAKYRIKPYINAFGGPRIFATSQYVKAYRPKTDYENNSNTNVSTTVSFMYGAALGARIAVSKHVSLDGRYEFMMGTQTQTTDLQRSEFNGVSTFNLKTNIINPEYRQWKIGVLFDLWDSYDETTSRTSNEVVQVNEYYYFDSSSNQYIKVNCRCSEKPVGSDTTSPTRYTGSSSKSVVEPADGVSSKTPDYNKKRSGGSIGVPSGSGGGGSRGSFPGIKPGGGGVIKN